MKRWNHLVEADDPLRAAEREFAAEGTPMYRARYVKALRRAGERERADYVEAVGILLAAVAPMRWSKPSNDEIERVAAHFSLAGVNQFLASRTPNRVNVLLLSTGDVIYHAYQQMADGARQRWRISGKLKTWKTRPDEFRIPIKWGLGRRSNHNDYLTQNNANQFTLDEE